MLSIFALLARWNEGQLRGARLIEASTQIKACTITCVTLSREVGGSPEVSIEGKAEIGRHSIRGECRRRLVELLSNSLVEGVHAAEPVVTGPPDFALLLYQEGELKLETTVYFSERAIRLTHPGLPHWRIAVGVKKAVIEQAGQLCLADHQQGIAP